ncbi:MAG TPA: hypothetical protein VKF36_12495 [Syntrophorhabdales bacterium]|nr:hypothetical protein [Syntrophorhabdales bacterium]
MVAKEAQKQKVFIKTGESLDELAKKCGIDAEGLKGSITAALGPFVTLRKWTMAQAPSYKIFSHCIISCFITVGGNGRDSRLVGVRSLQVFLRLFKLRNSSY